MTRFDVGDLLRMPIQRARYDLIMCRNTVIYFTEEVRDALHARFAGAPAPGGYLVVGTSERVASPAALGLTSPFHMCRMLGVEPDHEFALSALGEIGNVVGSSYINALAAMTGMSIEPTPPATTTGTLGALVAPVLADHAHVGDIALMLDSNLVVEGADCAISFFLVPDQGGVELLVAVGFGSCIGLALLDRRQGIAGLAHIVLPQSQAPMNENPNTFADLAVPQLVAELTALGARQHRLEAVVAGGAKMFGVASGAVTVREAGGMDTELYAELEVVS